MCFDIITVNIRVSIRVRGLHLVWWCFWGSFSTSHTIKALDGAKIEPNQKLSSDACMRPSQLKKQIMTPYFCLHHKSEDGQELAHLALHCISTKPSSNMPSSAIARNPRNRSCKSNTLRLFPECVARVLRDFISMCFDICTTNIY